MDIICINFLAHSSAESMKVRFRLPFSPCGIYIGLSENGTGFSPNTSIFHRLYYLTIVPFSCLKVVLICRTNRQHLQRNVCYFRCGQASDGKVLLFLFFPWYSKVSCRGIFLLLYCEFVPSVRIFWCGSIMSPLWPYSS